MRIRDLLHPQPKSQENPSGWCFEPSGGLMLSKVLPQQYQDVQPTGGAVLQCLSKNVGNKFLKCTYSLNVCDW